MGNNDIETITQPADYAKIGVAIVLAVAGFVFFYMATKQPDWLRGVAVAAGLFAGLGVYLTSQSGKSLIGFFRAAYAEMLRVVWPTRRETLQMTLVVFGFVVIMSIFLWIVDKALEFTLFDLILQWRK